MSADELYLHALGVKPATIPEPPRSLRPLSTQRPVEQPEECGVFTHVQCGQQVVPIPLFVATSSHIIGELLASQRRLRWAAWTGWTVVVGATVALAWIAGRF